MQHPSWLADAHDRSPMSAIADNVESILREKTAIHKYKDNGHCKMRMDTDREHNKHKERSLSALKKDITQQFSLRVYSHKNDTIPL